MTPIAWSEPGKILTVVAQRSLRSVSERIRREQPDWVVIRRTVEWQPEPFFYAFRPAELLQLADDHPDRLERPIHEVLELRESGSSATSQGRRPTEVELVSARSDSPSSMRAVHLDVRAQPVAVGEPPTAGGTRGGLRGRGGSTEWPDEPPFDLGSSRGGSRGTMRGGMRGGGEPAVGAAPESAAPDDGKQVEVTISAQAKEEVRIGGIDLVDFRLELKAEARPLRHQLESIISTEEKIRVLITVYGTALEAIDPRILEVDPPAAGQPTLGAFEIRGVEPGTAEIALLFRQGGTQLGSIRFTVSVVASAARPAAVSGTAVADPRDPGDDEVLTLLIEQRQDGNQIRYRYLLHAETLGLNYQSLESNPLLDRGGGAAATTLAYIEGIYERVLEEVLNWNDARLLTRKVRALGTSMSQELLDPEVSRRLWAVRDRLRTVQVTSWEPYIPWELLCLKHPDTGEVDDRFLGEYGLVRALPGEAQPRRLRLERWSYLAASYPHGTEEPLGAEVDYFTETLPGRGIQPTEVRGEYDAFFDALEEGNFDVLHLACHGESQHRKIEDAVLIIGDELGPGGQPRRREVDARTVEQLARLRERRPVIFLNACESGRHGASLTAWGGWPNAFLKAGAGVFVGTSWPVREKPASRFAHAFYDALLAKKTLAEAATAARTAIKNAGDASWLAYKVYGNPRARVENGS
jgi:hypothetical protein